MKKIVLTSTLLLALSLGIGVNLLNHPSTKVEATGPTAGSLSSKQNIDLHDNTDSEIRSYYSSLNALSESERKGNNILKNLKPILQDFTYYSYDTVWKIYEITDREWALSPASGTTYGTYDAGNQVINNYEYGSSSSNPKNDPYVRTLYRNRDSSGVTIESGRIKEWGSHQQTGGTNREHVWCQSRGFKASSGASGPAGTDVHHLMSGDGYVNGTPHNNNPYGYVDPNNITINSVNSQYGTYCAGNIAGSPLHPHSQDEASIVFEPQDSDKGDIARACFYMVACYNNISGNETITQFNPNLTLADYATSNGSAEASSATHPVAMGILSDLLEWHKLDPVDEFEIHRNNLIYNNYQHNRNPFIDFPEWVDYIWGDKKGTTAIEPSTDTINGYNGGGGSDPVSVTGVSLNKNATSIEAGSTETLTATVTPSNATTKTVTWTSSNTSVATVSGGIVTAVSEGNATITVTTVDGGYTATCAVTVTSPVQPEGTKKTINYSDTFTPALPTSSDSVNTTDTQHSNGEITFKEQSIYKGTSAGYLMFKQNAGFLYNTTSLGTITSVSITYSGGVSTTAKIGVYFGSTVRSTYTTTNNQTIAGQSQTDTFENYTANYGYFQISTSNKNCQITKIEINYTTDSTVHVTSVSLDKSNLDLNKGDSYQLVETVLPNNATDKTVTWSTTNSAVATVVDGLVTAVGDGSAVISVTTTDNSKVASCSVSVTTAVTGVVLNHTNAELEVEEQLLLVATVVPNDATDPDVYWETSDETIATVEDGVVTAIEPGNATITVTTNDGGYTATCNITVNVPATTPISTVVKALANGTYVANTEYTIKGTVTGVYGNSFYIQQGNHAMYVYNYPVSGNAIGKVVQLTSKFTTYNGQYETTGVSEAMIVDEEPGNITPTHIYDVDEFNNEMQNRVVTFTGLEYVSGTWDNTSKDTSITFTLNGNNVIYRTTKFLDSSVKTQIQAKINQVAAAKDTATFNLVGVHYVVYNSNVQFNLYSADQIVIVPNDATDKEQVQDFVDNYMHMTDYTGEGEGLCLGADGYYMKAKKVLTVMTSNQIGLFQSDDDFNDAQARYEAWARAYGDTTPYSTKVTFSNNITLADNQDMSYIIVIASIVASLSLLSLALLKRRKTKRN